MMSFRANRSLILLNHCVLWTAEGRELKFLNVAPTPQSISEQLDFRELLASAAEKLPTTRSFDVVLGSPWVRLELVTLPSTLHSESDAAAVVNACRERFRADRPSGSNPIVMSASARSHLVVAAIDQSLRECLASAFPAPRIRSIQPLLGWLSTGPQRFTQKDGWIAIREPCHLTLCHLMRGQLDSLRTFPIAQPFSDLVPLLHRQAAIHGLAMGDMEIASLAGPPIPPPPGWSHRWIFRDLAA